MGLRNDFRRVEDSYRAADQLLPELNHFLGETGNDRQDDKRLRLLLEQLRGYGLVSEIDDDERLRIQPLIVHVANPANLQNLLAGLDPTDGADPGQPNDN